MSPRTSSVAWNAISLIRRAHLMEASWIVGPLSARPGAHGGLWRRAQGPLRPHNLARRQFCGTVSAALSFGVTLLRSALIRLLVLLSSLRQCLDLPGEIQALQRLLHLVGRPRSLQAILMALFVLLFYQDIVVFHLIFEFEIFDS